MRACLVKLVAVAALPACAPLAARVAPCALFSPFPLPSPRLLNQFPFPVPVPHFARFVHFRAPCAPCAGILRGMSGPFRWFLPLRLPRRACLFKRVKLRTLRARSMRSMLFML